MSIPQYHSNLNPQLRIQVRFETEAGAPTKEFKAGAMSEPTFDALVAHAFGMSCFSHDSFDDYNVTFKYRIEEKHESRWINFDSTEGLGYAIQSNQDMGYIFITARIVKKGTVVPFTLPGVSSAEAVVKPKVKKTRATKAKDMSSRKNAGGANLSVDQMIIVAMKELYDLGIISPPRLQVALFSGYENVKSKGFANALSKLCKTQGLIEYLDSKSVRLTQAGITKAGSVTPPSSNEQVHEKIKNLLKGTETKIFDKLVDGLSHIREQVAADVGYINVKSKGFANSLSKMSSLGFLEYVKGDSKKSLIRLTDIAFPLGRPGEATDVSANEAVVTHDNASIVSDEMNSNIMGPIANNGTDAII